MTEAVAIAPVLVGERVRLRPARDDDAAHLLRWASDAEFAWFQWGRGPGRFKDEAAARDWMALFPPPSALLVIEYDRRPIGFTNYREVRPKPRSCEIGIAIGERELWSRGLGRDALRALLRHLTEDLGMHRVTLHVAAYNDRAIASYKACGFEVEGRLVDAVRTDADGYADSIAMAYVAGRARPAFDPRPVVLEGRHVRLEPLRMEHAAELFDALKDADWTYIGYGRPDPSRTTVADMAAFIRSALDRQITGEHLPWITRHAADGRALGTTRYGAIDRPNRSVEIGWTILGSQGRRTAANTEAKYLQLRHAFEDLGAIRVWLKTDVLNERSRRAIERIGAKLDGIVRNERVLWNGRIRDACYYSVIDREWPDVKRRLESLLVHP